MCWRKRKGELEVTAPVRLGTDDDDLAHFGHGCKHLQAVHGNGLPLQIEILLGDGSLQTNAMLLVDTGCCCHSARLASMIS